MLKTEDQIVTNGQKIFGFFTSKQAQALQPYIIEPMMQRSGSIKTQQGSPLTIDTNTNRNQPKAPTMHQHQQTYRPAPAPSTGAAVAAALATIALFALIGAMIAA